MERFRGGVWFWVLLLISMVPAVTYGQTLKKSQKCLYTATIAPDGGASQIVRNTKLYVWDDGTQTATVDFTYAVNTSKPGISKIVLTNGVWTLPLCDNASGDGCDYDSTGKLFISGALPSILPQGFNPALQNGGLNINLDDANGGVLAAGTYVLAQCLSRTY